MFWFVVLKTLGWGSWGDGKLVKGLQYKHEDLTPELTFPNPESWAWWHACNPVQRMLIDRFPEGPRPASLAKGARFMFTEETFLKNKVEGD